MSEDKLKNLSTKRLLNIKRIAFATTSCIEKAYYCECCNEFQGNDWETEVAKYTCPFWEYGKLIKSILATRENIETTKRMPSFRRTKTLHRNPNRVFSIPMMVRGKKIYTICKKSKKRCKGHFPHEYVINGNIKQNNRTLHIWA